MKLKRDFKNIPASLEKLHGKYLINSQGILLNKRTKRLLLPYLGKNRKNEVTTIFYYISHEKTEYIKIENLYRQVFQKEIWETIPRDQFIKLIKKLTGEKVKSKKNLSWKKNTTYKRRCHDCGKPTNNYRCKECWAKIRAKHGVTEADIETYGIWRV